MKFKSLCAVAVASLATSFACADQGDVIVTFSTPGPDTYADGSGVLNGEWYALCWAKDGSFDGITTDCKAIAQDEEVILAAPLAKDGKCPMTAFEFARNAKYDQGKFSIFLLDTRKNGAVAASVNGRPAFVNEASVAIVADGSTMGATASATAAAGSVAWAQPALQSDLQGTVDNNLVKITAFEILDANVKLTVENPTAATLVIKSGESVDKMNSYKLAPSTAKGETAEIIVPKDNAKFFAVGGLK